MTREDRFYMEQLDPGNRHEELPFGRRVGRIGTTLGWGTPDQELFLLQGRTWNLDQKYARHYGRHGLKFGLSIRRDCCQKTSPEAVWLNYTSRDDLVNNVPSEVPPVFGNGDYVGYAEVETSPSSRLKFQSAVIQFDVAGDDVTINTSSSMLQAVKSVTSMRFVSTVGIMFPRTDTACWRHGAVHTFWRQSRGETARKWAAAPTKFLLMARR